MHLLVCPNYHLSIAHCLRVPADPEGTRRRPRDCRILNRRQCFLLTMREATCGWEIFTWTCGSWRSPMDLPLSRRRTLPPWPLSSCRHRGSYRRPCSRRRRGPAPRRRADNEKMKYIFCRDGLNFKVISHFFGTKKYLSPANDHGKQNDCTYFKPIICMLLTLSLMLTADVD